MPKIHHEHIGTIAWCEQYRDSLEQFCVEAMLGDKEAELIVVNCAAHFYGLLITDYADIGELIAEMNAMEYELEFM